MKSFNFTFFVQNIFRNLLVGSQSFPNVEIIVAFFLLLLLQEVSSIKKMSYFIISVHELKA
jgi:hypothetical protein